MEKQCIKCNIIKVTELFELNRNVCKTCRYKQTKDTRIKKAQLIKETIVEKKCSECNNTLEISNFNKNSQSKDGFNTKCKECFKKSRKKKDIQNIITITSKICVVCNINYDISNFKMTSRSKDGYFNKCNNCWKPKEWNKEKQKMSEKKYVENNRDKIKEKYRRQGQKINRRIRDSLNHRIAEMLKSSKQNKNNKTIHYIGCDLNYLKLWFNFLFEKDMNWDNYGQWHIDHVIPCSKFNLENKEEQYKCFNWKNLRPCWAKDNITKGNKYIEDIILQHNNNLEAFIKINPLPTQSGNRTEGTE